MLIFHNLTLQLLQSLDFCGLVADLVQIRNKAHR